MSDFMDMFCEMLPVNSEIQNTDNEFRKVLANSVGTYMDEHDEIFDELFLTSATGGWLDAHGNDYGVVRKTDESDEDYRKRIIFEKLEYLTLDNLKSIYGIDAFAYVDNYNAYSNQLTSDNPYFNQKTMCDVDWDMIKLLNKKFVLGSEFYYIIDNQLEIIVNTSNQNILNNYLKIYELTNLDSYFQQNNNLKNVRLHLPKATTGQGMFNWAENLEYCSLYVPNMVNTSGMFIKCKNLKELTVYAPQTTSNCWFDANVHYTKLKYINATIPSNKKTQFLQCINGNWLDVLETLIINGEEISL